MRVDLVMRIRGSAQFMGRTLSRDDIVFEVVPQVGDGVIWHSDWSVVDCIYRYVGPDYVEVGLAPCGESEVEGLVTAGWKLR